MIKGFRKSRSRSERKKKHKKKVSRSKSKEKKVEESQEDYMSDIQRQRDLAKKRRIEILTAEIKELERKIAEMGTGGSGGELRREGAGGGAEVGLDCVNVLFAAEGEGEAHLPVL